MKDNEALMVDYIFNQNAIVMVCGDAAGMAKDVSKMIADIIASSQGRVDTEQPLLLIITTRDAK